MLRKILSQTLNSNPSYIEVYDNALTQKECTILINQFEHADTALCYKPEVKKCLQIVNADMEDRSVISNILQPVLSSYIEKYTKQYPGLYYTTPVKIYNEYCFQKYEKDDDGFTAWHCEHSKEEESIRVLTWRFYLNDAKSGTQFWDFSPVRAIMGRLVVCPAYWTHTHRSSPNKGLKYIITGWASHK